MKQIDAFLIHGIGGKIKRDYFSSFIKLIRKNLPKDSDVQFHPVDYSYLLYDQEQEIYSWMRKDKWKALRKFGCQYIADVLAYAPPRREARPGDFMFDVTKLLVDKYVDVQVNRPYSEKWLICHSLGCIVGFGFSWDVQLTGLITMGNPHDYFSVRYKDFGEDNSKLPHFINFHNPWDPISTRVSNNPNFKRVTDVLVSNLNPLKKLPIHAHQAYWSNRKVAQGIASILKS